MLRTLMVVVALAVLAGTASAGLRCKRLPRIVFFHETADVHDDGTWHRTRGKVEKEGHLAFDAVRRIRALVTTRATPTTVIRCLDALIVDENGAAANRACAVAKG